MINRKLRNRFSGLFAGALFLAAAALVAAAQPHGKVTSYSALNESTIKDIYKRYLIDRYGEGPFDLAELAVKWQEGSFAREGGHEAIALISDIRNHAHAEGYEHLFLLQFDGTWKIVRHEAVGDFADFKIVDIEGDGRLEVWLESGGGNQGYMETDGQLLSFTPQNEVLLFSCQGHDYSGTGTYEGEAVRSHQVSFRDTDEDGILEIIDKETVDNYKGMVKLSSKTITHAFKFHNGKFEEYRPSMETHQPIAPPQTPVQSRPTEDDPVALAKNEIERTKVVWTPVFYSATFGVYRIGGRIVMAGGSYILLESPELAIDLATGGFYSAATSLGKDFILWLVENAVRTPKQVCIGISKQVIDQGWAEYKRAYEIVKEYGKIKSLSWAEALEFLRNRFGAQKMGIARVLYESSRTQGYSIDSELARKTVEAALGKFSESYQQSLGLNGQLPIIKAAAFIRDLAGILEAAKAGLMEYPPYQRFTKDMAAINRSLLDEFGKFDGHPIANTSKTERSKAVDEPLFLVQATEKTKCVGLFQVGMTKEEVPEIAKRYGVTIEDSILYGEGGSETPVLDLVGPNRKCLIEFIFNYDEVDQSANKIKYGAQVQSMVVYDPRFHTAEGLQPNIRFGDARRIFGEGVYRLYEDSTAAVELKRFPWIHLGLDKGLWEMVSPAEWEAIYLTKYQTGEVPLSYLPDDLRVISLHIY